MSVWSKEQDEGPCGEEMSLGELLYLVLVEAPWQRLEQGRDQIAEALHTPKLTAA